MHPALNYRQSRRSACDRCRGFKLRCERDQVRGRSCERCLKAQVICTTSLSQSAFPSSKVNGPIIPSELDGSFSSNDPLSMSALHERTPSGVQRSFVPTGTLRAQSIPQSMHGLNSWKDIDPCSFLANGSTALGPNDFAASFQTSNVFPVPPDQWHNTNILWDTSPSWGNNSQGQPINLDLLNHEDYPNDQPFFSDPRPMSSCSNFFNTNGGLVAPFDDPFAEPRISTEKWDSRGPQSTQKQLLQLNIEIIEDVELLEGGSTALSSLYLLGDNVGPTVANLDVPIFRMLNHSTRLLDMIRDERQLSEAHTAITQSPIKLTTDESIEDGIATVSSHDSGYLTATVSPQGVAQISPPRHKLPLFLSLLTTYCHLIRLYHTIFTQLYQMFLIVPPPEESRFLLLASSQYGHLGMDGTLTTQVQVLIELSFNMLAKLEHELEAALSCESDGPSTLPASVLENTALAAIREQILAHEGILSGIPLRETMDCLSQLVNASSEP